MLIVKLSSLVCLLYGLELCDSVESEQNSLYNLKKLRNRPYAYNCIKSQSGKLSRSQCYSQRNTENAKLRLAGYIYTSGKCSFTKKANLKYKYYSSENDCKVKHATKKAVVKKTSNGKTAYKNTKQSTSAKPRALKYVQKGASKRDLKSKKVAKSRSTELENSRLVKVKSSGKYKCTEAKQTTVKKLTLKDCEKRAKKRNDENLKKVSKNQKPVLAKKTLKKTKKRTKQQTDDEQENDQENSSEFYGDMNDQLDNDDDNNDQPESEEDQEPPGPGGPGGRDPLPNPDEDRVGYGAPLNGGMLKGLKYGNSVCVFKRGPNKGKCISKQILLNFLDDYTMDNAVKNADWGKAANVAVQLFNNYKKMKIKDLSERASQFIHRYSQNAMNVDELFLIQDQALRLPECQLWKLIPLQDRVYKDVVKDCKKLVRVRLVNKKGN